MTDKDLTSYKFACVVARFLDEKIAEGISILNISNVSSFADYFVICSAQTSTQVKSLTENLVDKVKTEFERLPVGKEKDLKNRWNLVDYGDVVIHILKQEDRESYAIEKFWNHSFSIPRDTWLKESEEYSEYK
ncbi:MAG: ribosome silencing factor [bacterium]|nr:ribosome silencing factor [bacterium]